MLLLIEILSCRLLFVVLVYIFSSIRSGKRKEEENLGCGGCGLY